MKILMINVCCGVRSTGRICTDLATALEAQGHEVKIAYGREEVPKQFEKYAVRIGSEFDVKMHALKARLFDDTGFGSINATKHFIKWVKEYDPDVIHLHNIHGYYINVEILFNYLKACHKKIIWTLHDCWSFTGHTPYCDSINCERFVEGCHDCPLIKEYPKSFIDRSKENWLRKRDAFTGVPNLTIVTPSNWLKGQVEKSFLKDYEVKVINNGIDTSKFYPIESDFKKKYNIEDKTMLLGVATSWDKMKGLDDFLKLSTMLDNNYQIVLVGLTPKQLKRLPNNIIGIERTANVEELAKIYTAADIFLNLTYCDTYPTVNLEAISCGTPTIAYDTGGSSESVKVYGESVERGNIKKLLEAINNSKLSITEIKSDKFDKKITVNKYLKIYEKE